MAKNTSSYGADGGLTTTMDRAPIDIGRRPNFWGDFLRTRQFLTPSAAPVPRPGLGVATPPPAVSYGPKDTRGQAQMLAAPAQHAVYVSPADSALTSRNAAGGSYQRVAPGTPGGAFAGYSEREYDPTLDRDIFQRGAGGRSPGM